MEPLRAEDLIKSARDVTEKIVKAIKILQSFGGDVVLYINKNSELSLQYDLVYNPEGTVYSWCDYKIDKRECVKIDDNEFINSHKYLQARLDLLSNYSEIALEIYKGFLRLKSNLFSRIKNKEEELKLFFSDVLVKEKLDETK